MPLPSNPAEPAAGPLHESKSILYVMIDAEAARASRKSFDPAGHYARSDVFRLTVDRRQKAPAVFRDSD
jgi:nitrilase